MEEQSSVPPRSGHGGLLMTLFGFASVTPDVESRSSTSLAQHLPKTWECSSRRCRIRSKPIIRLLPDRGPYPVYPSGKSWYEACGKTGSRKKFYHNVISEADFAAQPFMSGVLATSCGTTLDHGVPTVGYGVECSTDHWKVKRLFFF